jgi:hypothetical protein
VPVVIVIAIAIVVVLVAVVFVASGRGGGMPAAEPADYAPLELGPVSATDIALLRPPTALWGYHQQATDEALERIAESIRERDVRIVALEQLVTDLSRDPAATMTLGAPYAGARHARPQGPAGSPALTVPQPALREALPGGAPGAGAYGTGLAGPGLAGVELAGPRQQDATEEFPAGGGPLSAPVADFAQPPPAKAIPPATHDGDVPPGEAGAGWPPEVSHD